MAGGHPLHQAARAACTPPSARDARRCARSSAISPRTQTIRAALPRRGVDVSAALGRRRRAFTPVDDLKLARGWADAYAKAKGPQAALVKQWMQALEKESAVDPLLGLRPAACRLRAVAARRFLVRAACASSARRASATARCAFALARPRSSALSCSTHGAPAAPSSMIVGAPHPVRRRGAVSPRRQRVAGSIASESVPSTSVAGGSLRQRRRRCRERRPWNTRRPPRRSRSTRTKPSRWQRLAADPSARRSRSAARRSRPPRGGSASRCAGTSASARRGGAAMQPPALPPMPRRRRRRAATGSSAATGAGSLRDVRPAEARRSGSPAPSSDAARLRPRPRLRPRSPRSAPPSRCGPTCFSCTRPDLRELLDEVEERRGAVVALGEGRVELQQRALEQAGLRRDLAVGEDLQRAAHDREAPARSATRAAGGRHRPAAACAAGLAHAATRFS